MNDKQLYTEILGITSPWEVKDVQMDPTASQVEVVVDYTKSTAPCAVCRGDCGGVGSPGIGDLAQTKAQRLGSTKDMSRPADVFWWGWWLSG